MWLIQPSVREKDEHDEQNEFQDEQNEYDDVYEWIIQILDEGRFSCDK